jgi:hypothetical protein
MAGSAVETFISDPTVQGIDLGAEVSREGQGEAAGNIMAFE